MDYLVGRATKATKDLHIVGPDAAQAFLDALPAAQRAFVQASGFEGAHGQVALLPGEDGLAGALAVVQGDGSPWPYAHLPARLPVHRWQVVSAIDPASAAELALGWALGTYAFERYKKRARTPGQLVWPEGVDRAEITRLYRATALARDLVTTPAEDLGPADIAKATKALAAEYGAKVSVIKGKDLVKKGYPAIYAVGKGSPRDPHLVDLTWGDPKDPKVTLVGKGVVFDSGGLDLKPAGGMQLMKKDMGGAAQVLGVALAVMDAKLPVRLRVLVPTVENAISGEAFRPLDVIDTRKGLTVEIGNTDAEGRLILCDALCEASRDKPDFILDFATLTGAARIALGLDVPALFSNDDALAEDLMTAGRHIGDPLWRMPLWPGYRRQLDSKVADMNNISEGRYGGAITAALFLQTFVDDDVPWAHVDLMAYNLSARPGRPAGGEAMGVRAAYSTIATRYPPKPAPARKKARKKK